MVRDQERQKSGWRSAKAAENLTPEMCFEAIFCNLSVFYRNRDEFALYTPGCRIDTLIISSILLTCPIPRIQFFICIRHSRTEPVPPRDNYCLFCSLLISVLK